MATNKHQALHDWVATCPLLTDTPLFDFLSERDGSVALSPTATDTWVKRYVRDSGIKQYSFQLQRMAAVSDSTDATNTENMQIIQSWVDWLEAQQKAENFPDFGENCYGYRIMTLNNMPTLAMRYENGMGKYTFPATIQYYEDNA